LNIQASVERHQGWQERVFVFLPKFQTWPVFGPFWLMQDIDGGLVGRIDIATRSMQTGPDAGATLNLLQIEPDRLFPAPPTSPTHG
jgi:glutaredoxin-related protein